MSFLTRPSGSRFTFGFSLFFFLQVRPHHQNLTNKTFILLPKNCLVSFNSVMLTYWWFRFASFHLSKLRWFVWVSRSLKGATSLMHFCAWSELVAKSLDKWEKEHWNKCLLSCRLLTGNNAEFLSSLTHFSWKYLIRKHTSFQIAMSEFSY